MAAFFCCIKQGFLGCNLSRLLLNYINVYNIFAHKLKCVYLRGVQNKYVQYIIKNCLLNLKIEIMEKNLNDQTQSEFFNYFDELGHMTKRINVSDTKEIVVTIQKTEKDRCLGYVRDGIALWEDREGFAKVIRLIESQINTIKFYGWNPNYEMEFRRVQSLLVRKNDGREFFTDNDFSEYLGYFSLRFCRDDFFLDFQNYNLEVLN